MSDDAHSEEKMKVGPGKTSQQWETMMPRWCKINAALGGTETMRVAGQAYLPKHTEETTTAYNERLSKSVFTNVSKQTLETWVGKPFSEKVKINDDVPDQIKTLLDNVDLCGNELQVFAHNWFMKGLSKAFAHVLVEFPRVDNDGTRTRADDLRENVRPYLVLIEPENVIAAKTEVVSGQEIVTHLRIRETAELQDPDDEFSLRIVHRIRVYDIGQVRLYEWRQGANKDYFWDLIDMWDYSFPLIPLVTFYANREAPFLGKPPIEDLVDLNIAHFQSTSDQTNILTVTRFPQLAVSGAVDNEQLTVGPNNFIKLSNPAAKVYYVEHQGQAIAAGDKDIESLERRMHAYGTQFLQKRPGRETATARAIDTAEANSELQDAAIRFNDALNQALYLMGLWINLDDSGTVSVQTNFGITEGSPESLQTLQLSRQNGDISRTQYVNELVQRGVLSDRFDPTVNDTELVKEQAEDLKYQSEVAKIEATKKPALTTS